MAIPPKPTPLLLLILTVIITPSSAGILSDLRSHSPSGVIHLNHTLLNHIFTSAPKSFFLIIFFHAPNQLPPPNLKSEFALISKSFIINNQNTPSLHKLFFCDVEINESSKKDLLRFGLHTLPDIQIVPPDINSDSIPIQVGLAESMASFIDLKTGISIGKIHRPPILSKTQLGFVIGAVLIWTPFMIKKLIAGGTVFHNRKIWICGTVFVYFFSVSGSMFILIRRIPLFVMDRKDPHNLMFFFQGHGMQFGAEGVCVGFLFTIVGLLLSLVTRVIVSMKDSMMQRVAMVGAMIVSFWAVKQVVVLSHWKTGYVVHAYLPSGCWVTVFLMSVSALQVLGGMYRFAGAPLVYVKKENGWILRRVTIFYQNEIGGLQVRSKEGKWTDIAPCTETLIVNIGDLMQAWSNGNLRSSEHSVVLKDKENTFRFFLLVFRGYKVVFAPDEVLGEKGWRGYRPLCADYMKFRENKKGKLKKVGFTVIDFAGIETEFV
ncbi:hypothetical protein SSX86_022807 [Deinandra increscens subsp. villosa]|uniref:Isopenicillin N synthase-like Fe(2+) 2OG dioxygenase domain-containing protein n=1 Tax=Deinandra increscens subsp. villosa TaxID=3103831 RepID=A0AAP0CPW4_9ASTR